VTQLGSVEQEAAALDVGAGTGPRVGLGLVGAVGVYISSLLSSELSELPERPDLFLVSTPVSAPLPTP
jgi:hypothetical protein